VSGRRWRACESSTVAGSRWVCGEEMEREREGGKDLGGKWVLGTKNGYRRRRRTVLFQNQIFAFFLFFFF
jgi:hypothetical protein